MRKYGVHQWPSGKLSRYMPQRPLMMLGSHQFGRQLHASDPRIDEFWAVVLGTVWAMKAAEVGQFKLANECLFFAIECYDPNEVRGSHKESTEERALLDKWFEARLIGAAWSIISFGGELLMGDMVLDNRHDGWYYDRFAPGDISRQLQRFVSEYSIALCKEELHWIEHDIEKGVAPWKRYSKRREKANPVKAINLLAAAGAIQ